MAWKQETISAPVSGALSSATGIASQALGATATVLNVASTLLGVARAFVGSTTDPFSSAYGAAVSQFDSLNNDLFGSGVFQLTINQFDIPGRRAKDDFGVPVMKPREALSLAIQSFDDLGDPNRPQFTDQATVSAYGFLLTAPTPQGLLQMIEELTAVFAIPDFKVLRERYSEVLTPGVVESRYPDWTNQRLNNIYQLRATQEATSRLLENLRGNSVTANDNLSDLIGMFSRKANVARRLISDLEDTLDNLSNALAATGIYYLDVPPGVGGNERLKDEIYDCDLALIETNYTAVSIFVGGGPSLGPVDTVRGLLT